jgi:hypothetical protein
MMAGNHYRLLAFLKSNKTLIHRRSSLRMVGLRNGSRFLLKAGFAVFNFWKNVKL